MTSPDLGRCNRALTSSTLTHSPPSPPPPPPRLLARRSLACPTGRSTDEREPARSSLDPLAIRSRGGKGQFSSESLEIYYSSLLRESRIYRWFFFWNEKRYNFRKMQERCSLSFENRMIGFLQEVRRRRRGKNQSRCESSFNGSLLSSECILGLLLLHTHTHIYRRKKETIARHVNNAPTRPA